MNLSPEESIKKTTTVVSQLIGANATKKGGGFGVVFCGPPGVGKTKIVTDALNKRQIAFAQAPLYAPFLQTVKFIHENRDKVILFDDAAQPTNPATFALLKSLLAPTPGMKSNEREILLNSSPSAMKREGLSDNLIKDMKFIFTGHIISIMNVDKLSDDIHALAVQSRIPHFRIDLTFEEKMFLIRERAKNPQNLALDSAQMNSIMELIEVHARPGCKNFDLRIMDKISAIIRGAQDGSWREAAMELLEVDPNLELVRVLLEMCKQVGHTHDVAVAAFKKKTGLTRSTFYNYRARLGIQDDICSSPAESDDKHLQLLNEVAKEMGRPIKEKSKSPSQTSSIQTKEKDDLRTSPKTIASLVSLPKKRGRPKKADSQVNEALKAMAGEEIASGNSIPVHEQSVTTEQGEASAQI